MRRMDVGILVLGAACFGLAMDIATTSQPTPVTHLQTISASLPVGNCAIYDVRGNFKEGGHPCAREFNLPTSVGEPGQILKWCTKHDRWEWMDQ